MNWLVLREIVGIVVIISEQNKCGLNGRWQGVDLKSTNVGDPPHSHLHNFEVLHLPCLIKGWSSHFIYIYIYIYIYIFMYMYMYIYFKLLVYWLKHIFEVLLAKYVSILVMLIVTLATGLNIHFRFYAFVKLIYPVTETICFQSPLEC